MIKYKFRVSVRVGLYDFHKDFEYEKPALDCFQAIASMQDVAIDGDAATVPSQESVADVTISRYAITVDVGNPHRQ